MLEFLTNYRSISIPIAVAGIALGLLCYRIARARLYSVKPSIVSPYYLHLIVIFAILSIGVPSFMTETISQWQGGTMVIFIVVDSLLVTALLYLTWLQIFLRPNKLNNQEKD